MPERFDERPPVAELVQEHVYPTTMHGTRELVCLKDSWNDPHRQVQDSDGNFVRKLGHKLLYYLRSLAD